MSDPARIRFEDFEADLRTEELFKGGSKLRLPHQSFLVLAMLLKRAGQLVTREELCAKLWPGGAHIEYDQRLNAAVNRLREVLVDSAEHPRFIETLPKRGYRFIAAIESVSAPPVGIEPSSANRPAADLAPPVTSGTTERATRDPAAANRLSFRNPVPLVVAGILVLAAVLIVGLANRSGSRAPSHRQVVPLASLAGKEIAPTFSPDGSQVAFAWNGDAPAQFDLYVKSLGSERLLRLTHQPSRWFSTAWSPDGASIAFVRETEESAGLFIIPALGGSERSIVKSGISIGYEQISWSPDGRRIAYAAYGPEGTPQIFVVSLDTAEAKLLLPASECMIASTPAFSPDGQQVAYVCNSSATAYAVKVAGLSDHSVRTLGSMFGEAQGLAWADENHLILGNDSGDGGEMWQFTPDGERQQLPFGEDGSAPTVAARGGRMAYVRAHKTVDVWRADLSAADPEQSASKFISSTRTQVNGRYSRDGSRISFQSNRSGSMEIWMSDAQGGDPDRLTSFNGPQANGASWCSDGHRIAFDSPVSGVSGIYVEDINERVPNKLLTSRDNLSSPTWSEDCRWLFAIEASHALYRIAATGGPAELFTDQHSSYSMAVGDRLIFNVLEADGVVLWSKPVGGGPEEPLPRMPKLHYEDSWAANAHGVYYSVSSSSGVALNFYDFATQATRRLMSLKQTPVPGSGPGLSISTDGRWLLYGQSGDESSEIMLTQAN